MKRLIWLILLLPLWSLAQTPNNTNTNFTNGLGASKFFNIPRGTTPPTTGVLAGSLFYHTTNGLQYYDGANWQTLSVSGGSVTSFNGRTGIVVPEAGDYSGFFAPLSRTITINGVTYDLSANRTYSVGTVTSVGATAGTGISVSGSPVTSSGSITITNTAPDQTVVLNNGAGISVTGTYPNFTITNTAGSGTGTVTNVSGTSPISVFNPTTTPVISIPDGAIQNVKLANSTISGKALGTDLATLNLGYGLTGTSYNGSATTTARVDTADIQTVSNFFPKGDTRYAKISSIPTQYWQRSGTTLSPATAGDDILTTGNIQADSLKRTGGLSTEFLKGDGSVTTLGTTTISEGGTTNGLSYSNGNFRLHKVNATNGGVLTTGLDTISGIKRFINTPLFNSTYALGQATFGSTGQGAKINLIEGGSGNASGVLGYNSATSGVLTLTNLGQIEISSTNTSGILGLRATGSSGRLQFRTGATQNAEVFSTGNWLLQQGGTFTDAGYKLDVTGTGRYTGNLTANSFIKSGGTGSQFLMGNGTVQDTTTIQTVSNFFPKGDTRYYTKSQSDVNYIKNQFDSPQSADLWINGIAAIDQGLTVGGNSIFSGTLGIGGVISNDNTPSGTVSTDSILVKDDATNTMRRISPNAFLTPTGSGSGLSGVVLTSGNQTGIAGNKSWTGTNTFVTTGIAPTTFQALNSNDRVIQATAGDGEVAWLYNNSATRPTLTLFNVGGGNLIRGYNSFAPDVESFRIAGSGLISSTPQGTLYGTATGSVTSAQLATSLTDETGTGSAVFSASPTFTGTVTGTDGHFSGSFGIGITPTFPLHVSKNLSNNYIAQLTNTNTTAGTSFGLFMNAGTNSADRAINVNNASNTLTLMASYGNGDFEIGGSNATKASGTAWINPSDLRLKTNVGDYSKGLAEVLAIKPKTWYFNKASGFDTTKKHLSPIAQELQKIMPEMVSTYKGKLNGKDVELLQVDASDMTWLLVKAIQEQQAIIEKLNARITDLENK